MKLDYVNCFLTVLGAPLLEKRPIEVPNLKSLRLFPLFAGARERTSAEMHSTESRVVIDQSSMLSAVHFSARNIYELGQLRG